MLILTGWDEFPVWTGVDIQLPICVPEGDGSAFTSNSHKVAAERHRDSLHRLLGRVDCRATPCTRETIITTNAFGAFILG